MVGCQQEHGTRDGGADEEGTGHVGALVGDVVQLWSICRLEKHPCRQVAHIPRCEKYVKHERDEVTVVA